VLGGGKLRKGGGGEKTYEKTCEHEIPTRNCCSERGGGELMEERRSLRGSANLKKGVNTLFVRVPTKLMQEESQGILSTRSGWN